MNTNKKPVSVIIISSLFIAAGLTGFIYHLSELNLQDPFAGDTIPVFLIRLAAVAGGIITLLGYGYGRCTLIVWMLYHVILSIFHTLPELLMHSALLAIISYYLLRPKTSDYFKQIKHNIITIWKSLTSHSALQTGIQLNQQNILVSRVKPPGGLKLSDQSG